MSADWKVSYRLTDSDDDMFADLARINTLPDWVYLEPISRQIEIQKTNNFSNKKVLSPTSYGHKNEYSTFAIRSYDNDGPYGISIIRFRIIKNQYA